MSTERYDVLVIGFVVEMDDILRPFAVTVPERSHMEDRFDPTTGKKLPSAKVVDDEEHDEYDVDGKRYDDAEKVLDHLCKECGGKWATLHHGDTEAENVVSIEPKLPKKLTLDAVGKLAPAANAIRKAFKKYGVELGEAEVQTYETWG